MPKQPIESTPLTDKFVDHVRAAFPNQRIDVRFSYNGSGDDGWFDDYSVDFIVKLPNGNDCTDIGISGWYSDSVLNRSIKDLPLVTIERCQVVGEIAKRHNINDIYSELGKILERKFPGWEINDGASGCFIYRSDGTRMHEHSTNIMETLDEEEPF